ncbi:MAG: hypothetical protein ABSA11_16010 [Candidatus Bathyarchaeia archaeon]
MKPCEACLENYGEHLCKVLKHCVFEGSNEWLKKGKTDYQEIKVASA